MKNLIAMLLLCFTALSSANTYTVVSSHSPGDVGDLIQRTLLDKLPYTPDYASGGDAVLAPNKFVTKLQGNYLFFSSLLAQQVLLPALRPEMVKYTDDDFVPITELATSYFVLFSSRKVTLEHYLKADTPTIATPGSAAIFIGDMLAHRSKRPANVIPYKTMAQATTDAMGGHVDFAILRVTEAYPVVAAGRGHAIAITAAKRSSHMPSTPTLAEYFPGLIIDSGWGLYGQRGMTKADVSKVLSRISSEYALPETKAVFEKNFLYAPVKLGPEALTTSVLSLRKMKLTD